MEVRVLDEEDLLIIGVEVVDVEILLIRGEEVRVLDGGFVLLIWDDVFVVVLDNTDNGTVADAEFVLLFASIVLSFLEVLDWLIVVEEEFLLIDVVLGLLFVFLGFVP